jgi:predicted AAA+ superfamily ATPase
LKLVVVDELILKAFYQVILKQTLSLSWCTIHMIQRDFILSTIRTALDRSRVVALVGPRQSGKTTLARQFVSPDSLNYCDLEDLTSLARLDEPMTALRNLRGLVVVDEIQRRPDLFPILRVLCDRPVAGPLSHPGQRLA